MNNNNSSKFLENSSIYMFSTIITFTIGVLVLPVYTRFLSPGDFGIVILFMMFGTMLTQLLSVSLHFASYRYYFKYKNELERFSILNASNMIFLLIIFILSGIIIYNLSDWLASVLFDGELTKKLIQLSFLSGCFEYLFLYMTTLLTAQERAIPLATITISRALLSAALSFYFIFQYSLTYMARINALIISQVIVVICLIVLTRSTFVASFSFRSLKESLKLSFPLIPNQAIGMIHDSFDKVMLNMFHGTFSVGYYSFGSRFAQVLKMLMDSINKAWEPFFMNLATKNSVESKKAIITRFYSLAFLYMVVGLCVIYFSEEMIKLLTTKEFYPSIYIVPVYVYFYLFSIIGTLTMPQISFSEKMTYILPSTIVGVIINISLNMFLIPNFGAIGAAGATAIASLFSQLINYYYAMKLFPLPLRKIKLVSLYLIIIIYTLFIYPIIGFEINFFIKILLKMLVIATFIFLGIKLQFVEKTELDFILKKVKLR